MEDYYKWEPEVLFRLWRGQESADFFACFRDGQGLLIFRDVAGKPIRRTGLFFFPGFGELLQLAKKEMPESRSVRDLGKHLE